MTNKTLRYKEAMILFLVILFKVVLFDWIHFDEIELSALAVASKLIIAGAVASLALICKRKWSILIVLLIIDMWIEANLIYSRANGIWMNYDTMRMAGNMNGFWASIFPFMKWVDILFPLASFTYIPFGDVKARRKWRTFVLAQCALYFITVLCNSVRYSDVILERELRVESTGLKKIMKIYRPVWDPFYEGENNAQQNILNDVPFFPVDDFIHTHSIIDYIYWNIGYAMQSVVTKGNIEEQKKANKLTDNDTKILFPNGVNFSAGEKETDTNVIVILFES